MVVPQFEGDVHIWAGAIDVVGIYGLGVFSPKYTALATRLAVVKASPCFEDIGSSLFAGGIFYLRGSHWWVIIALLRSVVLFEMIYAAD